MSQSDADEVKRVLLGKEVCYECKEEFLMAELVIMPIWGEIDGYNCIDCYVIAMRPKKRTVRY